jgi:hypothetical protein
MKKLIGLLITLAPFFYNSFSQNLTFSIQYKPEKKYSMSMMQTTKTEIRYLGSESDLKNLKEAGTQNPTITSRLSKVKMDVKTGKVTDENGFPLTITIMSTSDNKGQYVIPTGTMIYGNGTIGSNEPALDSVVADELSDEAKDFLLQSLQKSMTQFLFLEKKLKIGESFSIESPFSIPLFNNTIDMSITTTYKLISVANGIGNFAFTQKYTMITVVPNNYANVTGKANGKLAIDIINRFYINYQNNTELVVNFEYYNYKLETKTTNTLINSTVITNNR